MICLDLTNQVALVTGAIGGLGRRISADLARCGADLVVAAHRDSSELTTFAAELEVATGRTVHSAVCDVSDPEAVRRLGAKLKTLLERPVSILVNNAGVYDDYSSITNLDDAVIDRTIDTNLKGTLYMTREFGRWMVESKISGSVINIASGAARGGRWHHAHYCASKAGVVGATRAMAIDLAPAKINVNAIVVGFVDVGRFDEGTLAGVKRDILPRILLRHPGTPQDISAMVCYLASEYGRWITGTDYVIDGGESAGRVPLN